MTTGVKIRVVDYINQADVKEVCRLYNLHYAEDRWGREEVFKAFKAMFNSVIVIQSDFDVVVSQHPSGNYDVSGVTDEDKSWAIEYTPWGEWKTATSYCNNRDLSTEEMACHIYYEMTWGGWPEDMQEKLDELEDAMEQVERDIISSGSFESFDDFMKDRK